MKNTRQCRNIVTQTMAHYCTYHYTFTRSTLFYVMQTMSCIAWHKLSSWAWLKQGSVYFHEYWQKKDEISDICITSNWFSWKIKPVFCQPIQAWLAKEHICKLDQADVLKWHSSYNSTPNIHMTTPVFKHFFNDDNSTVA